MLLSESKSPYRPVVSAPFIMLWLFSKSGLKLCWPYFWSWLCHFGSVSLSLCVYILDWTVINSQFVGKIVKYWQFYMVHLNTSIFVTCFMPGYIKAWIYCDILTEVFIFDLCFSHYSFSQSNSHIPESIHTSRKRLFIFHTVPFRFWKATERYGGGGERLINNEWLRKNLK